MRPVWLCPLVASAGSWPTVPAGARTRPTSTSASGAPSTSARTPPTAPRNRAIEAEVHELGGHKSLYSEAFYDRETFDRLYDGANLARGQGALRPRQPADQPLRQGGEETMTIERDRPIGDAIASLLQGRLPVRFTAYDGSAAGPADAPIGLRPDERARAGLPAHRARRPRHGAAPTSRATCVSTACTPATPTTR